MDKIDDNRQGGETPTMAEKQQKPARHPAADRALKEAEERRKRQKPDAEGVSEVGGRKGPDPARYGDWEKDGIVSDF